MMATWGEFAAAAPELAERGFEQLSIPIAYLATVRRDGAPRLHPLSPLFAGGRLFVAIEGTSPRKHDLGRDGRYSLHALPPMLSEHYDEFEFNVTGRAALVTDAATRALVNEAEAARSRPPLHHDAWLFELDIDAALTTVWDHTMVKRGDLWLPEIGPEGPRPTRRVWKANA